MKEIKKQLALWVLRTPKNIVEAEIENFTAAEKAFLVEMIKEVLELNNHKK